MIEENRYRNAIKRNLYEVAYALLEYSTLRILNEYNKKEGIYVTGEGFFNISYRALFNDMVAHSIKVLDKDRKSATFWYILKTDKAKAENLRLYSKEKIKSLRNLASKLKTIRNKTHFHIDKEGVVDPKMIWGNANIKGRELEESLHYLFSILNELHKAVFNKNFLYQPEDYDGTDLIKLLELAKSENLI
ncbi:MAG: hypothetical protein ISS47_03915 [Candidatus Omnitrophica bacterium]|nr:hypothetical protein [Candidatus Omnitrophota bacterium]